MVKIANQPISFKRKIIVFAWNGVFFVKKVQCSGAIMKKILFCASTASHLLNFHLPYIQALFQMGYEVHALVNEQVVIPCTVDTHVIPFEKRLLSIRNVGAIKSCRTLLQREIYDVIVTNTALAGIIVRMAVLTLAQRPIVIHIAGGYLFPASFSLKKLIYLIPEKIVSVVTDTVIVMNNEDYLSAQKHHLYFNKLLYIKGLGVDLSRFVPATQGTKDQLRKKYGIDESAWVFVFTGEFNRNKNQSFLIEVFSDLQVPNVILVLLGTGILYEKCKRMTVEHGVSNTILLPGFSNTVSDWYRLADAAISASGSEGLPFSMIEAMSCGLPIYVSDIKGHRELVNNGNNGFLFSRNDRKSLQQLLRESYGQRDHLAQLGKNAATYAQQFSIQLVKEDLLAIYKNALAVLN